MRIKTLLLTAGLVAAGVATSMAQSNVYSLNVVGYINLNLATGLNQIANQLDLDGTGTNNTITEVFSNSLPSGSSVYKFENGAYVVYGYSTRGGWSGNDTFNPGEGIFVSVPSPTTITLVGQVLQGTLTNSYINPAGGLSMISSVAPISATIDSTGNGGLNYVPASGDNIYLYDTNTSAYDVYGYSTRGGWAPSDPVIPVGAGFFIQTANTSWVETFSVQ